MLGTTATAQSGPALRRRQCRRVSYPVLILLGRCIGSVATSGVGRKRNDGFETETVESCRFLGRDPADLFRPVSLVAIRPECADSVEKLGCDWCRTEILISRGNQSNEINDLEICARRNCFETDLAGPRSEFFNRIRQKRTPRGHEDCSRMASV